jgi:hypothetical protein
MIEPQQCSASIAKLRDEFAERLSIISRVVDSTARARAQSMLRLIPIHRPQFRLARNCNFPRQLLPRRKAHNASQEKGNPMGFIFRTVFWLSLAIVIVPPQARLGGDDTADFENLDVAAELQNAGATLWGAAASTLNACETNPQLCKAGAELWKTTLQTSASLAQDAQTHLENMPEPPVQVAEAAPRAKGKIQARVE